MFQNLRAPRENLVHLARIEREVRTRFALEEPDIVLVSEDRGTLPGFPALSTTVRFWKGPQRYRLRVFRAARDVVPSDIPVAWLLRSLRDEGEPDCC